MNARAKQLLELGRGEYVRLTPDGLLEPEAHAIIAAIAVMLAAPAAKKTKPEGPALPFSPQAMHQALQSRVGHLVTCDLVNGQTFGFLGRKLKGIAGLETADLERLVSWIEAGGLAWMTSAPTFQTVVHNCDKWFNTAREWDRRGRQELRKGGSNVGAADDATTDVRRAFNTSWRAK